MKAFAVERRRGHGSGCMLGSHQVSSFFNFIACCDRAPSPPFLR